MTCVTGLENRNGSDMEAIAEGLFTDETPPRLIGGRHAESGRVVFPCPDSAGYAALPLPSEGTLWSYTVQRFRPKSPPYAGPEAFEPWVVAYVELPGAVIVEARLVGAVFEDIRIGMPLRFTRAPLDPARQDSVLIPAYEPMEPAA